ncbi:major facilitator superfamily domain-containing protein [Pisolithus croceorrhizus]|nr:major facilitator superfamily domain-containing protein [Pisolithus croceorrhizus]KAI6164357.1 major facilitator superfamily domain-containing protein [Pisolithus thermaeus]
MAPDDEVVHDEADPFLPECNADPQVTSKPSSTPLPVGQLAALCAVRLVDPIAFSQLFPYVNDFINDLHLTDDPSRIGFYSGLVESSFALSQLCSIYLWAKLSDVVGRKPVILTGTLGTAIATLGFGLSNSLAGILFARGLGGLFSGNIAVIHSMLGEITDSSNQARAIPFYTLMWPIGCVVGLVTCALVEHDHLTIQIINCSPLIGGAFSHAASKYPDLLDYAIFKKHPYFCPCLVSAIIAFFGVLLGFVFLKETVPSKRKRNNARCTSSKPNLDNKPPIPEHRPMGVKEVLACPAIFALVSSGFSLSFVHTSFDVVFVLFCYSALHSGGLAFSDSKIGMALAIAGCISSTLQLFFMPYLLRKFDCAKMYLFSMSMFPFVYFCLPFLNLIALWGSTEDGNVDTRVVAILWVGIAVTLGLSKIGTLAFSISIVLVKEHSPTPGAISQSNVIVQFAMCFARSFAPFIVSSLFALSVDSKLLWGYLWVVVMISLSSLSCIDARRILLHCRKQSREEWQMTRRHL